ncbi:recombinase family protein [Flavobacterium sp.]|uniref:recombinase family protein n=1 Tax=Flavobacterium sp. TaxID=239 RepID=UPI003BCAB233
MEKAIIVSRCSTNEKRQDVSRQSYDLENKFSKVYEIVKKLEYYKSGEKNEKEIDEIIKYAITNDIQHILFSEISRIGRRVIETLIFIENCTKHRINVHIDNYNMNSLNDDKSENMMTKIMLQIGASFAEMELKQTHSRLNSGRAKYIANGGRLGRNPDTKLTKEQILEKHKDVIKYLNQGQSIRNIMKLTTKSSGTIQKVKQTLK